VAESQEEGYGMVHLSIVSRVSGDTGLADTLSMPEGMEFSISPPLTS